MPPVGGILNWYQHITTCVAGGSLRIRESGGTDHRRRARRHLDAGYRSGEYTLRPLAGLYTTRNSHLAGNTVRWLADHFAEFGGLPLCAVYLLTSNFASSCALVYLLGYSQRGATLPTE